MMSRTERCDLPVKAASTKARVLIVDDEHIVRSLCRDALLEVGGFEVELCSDGESALMELQQGGFDLLITDINLHGMDGVEVLRRARLIDAELPVLMITGYPTLETSLSCLRLGATDYLLKPVLPDDLVGRVEGVLERCRLREENRLLRRRLDCRGGDDHLLGASAVLDRVRFAIERYAGVDLDVLILGETGTGKELVARTIHRQSPRGGKPFVAIDCGAIPETLMESEFFGHERGAFTGAGERCIGLLEYAEGGTVFLDEIGELPLALQAKLLRAVQERCVRRVGGRREVPIDIRIIAASNRDLVEEVAEGRFREDLFFRVRVGEIKLPPLRERVGDVRLLLEHFIERVAGEMGMAVPLLDDEAAGILERYSWPGNVRELGNCVRRILAMLEGPSLTVEDIPPDIRCHGPTVWSDPAEGQSESFYTERDRHLARFEQGYLEASLREHRGDVSALGRACGIPRRTVYRLLEKYGLDPEAYRHPSRDPD